MDIKETLIAFLSERYGWSEKEIDSPEKFIKYVIERV